ncbi:MAG: type II toxin-antitoxin system RelE/ParE family toxin [Chlorobi bacterium]|nr:type II toxin-antitoxin system RelE/ParE family toxin [Chlorobiota bacterium]
MVKYLQPIWGTQAENDLKEIYLFYAEENENYALKIIDEITISAETIYFAEQYQKDEILGLPYRRFFVKHWKIVYKPNNDSIMIFRVFDTRQNPRSILKL